MRVSKLAQPGYDVKTAGDENLIFNSNWPTLKIYKQGSYMIKDFTQTQTIATHGLGYAPFFYWFSNENIEGWESFVVPRTSQPRAEMRGEIGSGDIWVDETKLFYKLSPSAVAAPGYTTIYWYIFALPIKKDYKAPIIQVGGQNSLNAKSSRVFKIAKEGKDITSDKLEDYVLHSDARSPMVHMVKSGILGETTKGPFNLPAVTAVHNLGYKPMFFGFLRIIDPPDNAFVLVFGNSVIPGVVGFDVNETEISYIYVSPIFEISIVILKDPFIVDYSVRVDI